MPSAIPFFEKAHHFLAKLRVSCADRPRQAAFRLALWAWEKTLTGNLMGDMVHTHARITSASPLTIGVLLRGGIGDEIMSLAYIHELVNLSETACRVDIFSACPVTAMQSICFGLPYMEKIYSLKDRVDINHYDLVIDILRHAKVTSLCEESLKTHSLALHAYIQKLIRFQREHTTWYTDENQAMGIHYADVMGTFRRGQADFDGSLDLKDSTFTLQAPLRREELSSRFGLNGDYITIQRESGLSSQSLKLWSAAKYTAMLDALCREHSTVPAVLIGKEKNFALPAGSYGHILDLRGRTNFEEFMTLVRYACLHIGCEGVVPHMRHYLRGGPSLVLFGPSCARQLGYPENSALSGTECPNGCEGITLAWQEICLKDYDCCRSLEEVTTDQVMDRVRSLL